MLPLIRKRRSIREFIKRPVEREKIDLLIEAALRAPSSRNLNPWEFIIVDQQDLLMKLSYAKEHGSAFLKGAPLGIIVCADPIRSDVWVEDCSIASIFIQMVAESLELGSCWIQIRERMHDKMINSESYVRKLLHIPEHLKVESVIAIGYPACEPVPHRKENLPYKKVYKNNYGENG